MPANKVRKTFVSQQEWINFAGKSSGMKAAWFETPSGQHPPAESQAIRQEPNKENNKINPDNRCASGQTPQSLIDT
jgi:hypothetical protein